MSIDQFNAGTGRKGAYIKDDEEEKINLRLYNIRDDQEESVELSATHPEIVLQLLHRLAFHNSTALVLEQTVDDTHCSDLTGGAWVPWQWQYNT